MFDISFGYFLNGVLLTCHLNISFLGLNLSVFSFRPVEVLQSNREYTEDDVTDMVVNGSSPFGRSRDRPFDFPGLRNDIEAIERHFSGGLKNFFDAAEEMRNSIFGIFADLPSGEPSKRRGISIEGHSEVESSTEPNEPGSGRVDFSSLAKDV